MYTYFNDLNTRLLGLSLDSNDSHLAWLHEVYLKTGILVPFPIISDRNGTIARKYGMINTDNNTETLRNVFIIDDKGIIRLILVYPKEIGRSIPEILRSLQALQNVDKYNVNIPANFVNGDPFVQNNPNTYKELEKRIDELSENMNGMNWYLMFKTEEDIAKQMIKENDKIITKDDNIENKK